MKPRPMQTEEIEAVAGSLARAFMNDPLQNYTFPDEAERRERSPAHFRVALEYGLKYGEVSTLPGIEGAIICLKPGETEITPEKAEAGGLTRLPEVLGEEPANRFLAALDFIGNFHTQDVPEPHWYVMVLGVDPAHHGKGFGRRLLQPLLEKAKENGFPVYLETAQPNNVGFYRYLGFKVLRAVKDPVSGLDMWTFRWDG